MAAVVVYLASTMAPWSGVTPTTVTTPTTQTGVATTTPTIVTPIEAKANASLSIDNGDWDVCQEYPINVTIEFKWKTHEWRAAGLKSGEHGEVAIDVEIRLVRDAFSPIIKNGTFFVEICNYRSVDVEMGPLLVLYEGPDGRLLEPKEFIPKEEREYIVNKVTFDFDFHPEEDEVELTGVDYVLEYMIEIGGEIDHHPIEVEVSCTPFPWLISI